MYVAGIVSRNDLPVSFDNIAADTLRESAAVSLSLRDANCHGASIDLCVPGVGLPPAAIVDDSIPASDLGG